TRMPLLLREGPKRPGQGHVERHGEHVMDDNNVAALHCVRQFLQRLGGLEKSIRRSSSCDSSDVMSGQAEESCMRPKNCLHASDDGRGGVVDQGDSHSGRCSRPSWFRKCAISGKDEKMMMKK